MFKRIQPLIDRVLQKTQQYTGVDTAYVARGGFWLSMGELVATAASFLLAIAFANLLDPVVYGNYRYILSIIGILIIFTLTGIWTAVAQAVARGLEGGFYTGFRTKLKWGLLGSMVALGGALYYWLQGNTTLPIPLLLIAIFLPLMQASQVYGSFLTGKKLFRVQVKYSVLSQILSAGSIIATLFLTQNILWIVAVYFVSNTFANYFFYLLTRSRFLPNKKEDPQTISYGKHLSLIDVFGQVAFYLDRILIFHYLGAVEVAIYHFALIPPEAFKGFLKNIQPLALPKFAQRTKEETKVTVVKKAGKLFLLLIPVVGLYIVIAPLLYKTLFPQYLDSIFFSQVFALSLLATPIMYLAESALQSQKAQKELYQFNIVGSLLQITLLFVFIYFYGLLGAIVARIIGRLVYVGLGFVLVKRM